MKMLGIRRTIRTVSWLAIVGLFVLLLALVWGIPTKAQLFPNLEVSETNAVSFRSIPTFTRGNLDISPVFLDGKVIASVASFIQLESNLDDAHTTFYDAASRSHIIHSKLDKNLQKMVRYSREVLLGQGITDVDAQEIALKNQLLVDAREQGGSVSVTIQFPKNTDLPEVLYTVTEADITRIRFGSSEPLDIAQVTAIGAENTMLQAWRERQSPHLMAQGRRASLTLLTLMGLSASLAWMQKRFAATIRKLGNLLANADTVQLPDDWISGLAQLASTRRLTVGNRKESLRIRYSLDTFIAACLYWGQWLIWTIGIGYLTSLFYWSRPLSNWILGVTVRNLWTGAVADGWPPSDWLFSFGQEANIGTPMFILLFVLVLRLTLKGGDALGDFWIQGWGLRRASQQRKVIRTRTLSKAYKAWLRAIVYLILGVAIADRLHQLGTISQAVAVFLGLFSFALSLASQNLLKDLIAGLLILWEDQFAVGDVIVIDSEAGLVEKISLRVTQLRNLDGELISIPNGAIGKVKNLSSEWSRVNYEIEVAYDADLDRVLEVIGKVAQLLYRDPDWQEKILEAPEILGVETIAHTGISIRLIIKTQPLEQWSVAREFRYRLKRAFDEQEIPVGIPQQKMVVNWPTTAEQPELFRKQ